MKKPEQGKLEKTDVQQRTSKSIENVFEFVKEKRYRFKVPSWFIDRFKKR